MLPINKIVCPTDFSEPSYEALKTGVEMADHFSSELILVHVVTPIPFIPIHDDPSSFNLPLYEKEMEASAQKSLNEVFKEKIPSSVNGRTMVMQGDPATQIVRLADNEHAEMIIIATHGLTGLRKFMFGSVTEKVIRFANCPVLSIRVSASEDT